MSTIDFFQFLFNCEIFQIPKSLYWLGMYVLHPYFYSAHTFLPSILYNFTIFIRFTAMITRIGVILWNLHLCYTHLFTVASRHREDDEFRNTIWEVNSTSVKPVEYLSIQYIIVNFFLHRPPRRCWMIVISCYVTDQILVSKGISQLARRRPWHIYDKRNGMSESLTTATINWTYYGCFSFTFSFRISFQFLF